MIEKHEKYHRLGAAPARAAPVALTEIGKTDAAQEKRTHFPAKSDALGGWRRGWLLS
jgi:hypothetical protein